MIQDNDGSNKDDLTVMEPKIDAALPKKKKSKVRVLSSEQRIAKEQREAERRVAKASKLKRSIDNRLKKARIKRDAINDVTKALDGNTTLGHVVSDKELETVHQDVYEEAEIIFQPNPGPQTAFFESSEQELLFGGAAGGGKSYALIIDAARDAWHPEHRGIVFRKTIDELRNLISKSKLIYPQLYPKCRWLDQKSMWSFPSGAEVWYTYLDRDDDVERYQGQEFNYIGFDELGHWASPYAWDYMRSRLRTTAPDLKLIQRGTANPGGAGGWWLKKMFIDPAAPNDAFWAMDIETGEVLKWPDDEKQKDGTPHSQAGLPLFKRRFIPSRLKDNPHLYNDGRYQRNLLALPEVQRKRLLEGDWDVVEGAAFSEFSRAVHVVEPFKVPDSWVKFRACDYGYARHGAVLWFACDPDGRLYVYREFYRKGLTADKFAELTALTEKGEHIRYGVMDSSMWDARGETGPNRAEVMNRILRPPYRPSDRSPGSRISSKLEIHRRLAPTASYPFITPTNETIQIPGRPLLQIFSNCHNLIRTLPALMLDKDKPEDVDTDQEDDLYDALRYGIQSRPLRPQMNFLQAYSMPRVTSRGPTIADRSFGY